MLLALDEILHCKVQRVQGPDVESRQCCGKRKDDQEDEWSCVVGSNGERGDGIHDAKEKVGDGQPSDDGHGLAQGVLDHSIAHAHNQQ